MLDQGLILVEAMCWLLVMTGCVSLRRMRKQGWVIWSRSRGCCRNSITRPHRMLTEST